MLFLISENSIAQNYTFPDFASEADALKNFDSLRVVLYNVKDENSRAKVLTLLSENQNSSWGSPDSLIRYSTQALQLMENIELNDEWRGRAYRMLGSGHRKKGNTTEGLKNFFNALKISRNVGNNKEIIAALNDIGSIYNVTGYSYSEASKYYFAALKLAEEIKDRQMLFMCYFNMALNEYNQINYKKALKYFLYTLKTGFKLTQLDLGAIYYRIGSCYQKLNNYPDGEKFAQMSARIAREINDRFLIPQCNILLGTIYAEQAKSMKSRSSNLRYKTALEFLNGGVSVLSYQGKPVDVRLTSELGEGYLGLIKVYTQIKDYKNALEYTNKYSILKDYFKNQETQNRVDQLKLQFEREMAIAQENAKQQKLQLEKRRMKNLLLFGVTGIAMVSGLTFLILRQRLLKRRAIEKAEAFQRIAELEMQALRAQMNPHFIFNCLSSINLLILENNTDVASDYLTRFSRLIRMILSSSEKSSISLEEDIQMLELYLKMEQLRLNNKFEYRIQIAKNLEVASIVVPPLLMQPVCENAIWHGLHQKDNGQLNIDINDNENTLLCIITDNGTGRRKDPADSSSDHKPMGMKLTTERLALFNNEKSGNGSYEVEDLTDEFGKPAGTRVIIKIKNYHWSNKPIKNKYESNYYR